MMFKNPILLGNLAFGCLPLCGCFAEVAIWRLYRKAGEMEENHRGGTSVILVEMGGIEPPCKRYASNESTVVESFEV